jgi:hypothetical protein
MSLPTHLLTTIRRYLPLATACALLTLCALAAAAHAEWGELGHFQIPIGAGEKQVNFVASSSVLALAADSADSSYYIGDEPKEGEYRIQRFVEGKEEASVSFTPPEPKKAHGAAGETAVGLQLTVDPVHSRVYALVLYKRRSESEKEEKELEKEETELGNACHAPKTCWGRFPLDSEEQAAGELYAFELSETGKSLVSAKDNTEHKPAPIVGETTAETSTTAFADQSEQPKEALLHPRGMAVDPTTGDVAILGVEDEAPNEKVEKEEAEKQCRAAVQFIILEEKAGKLAGHGHLGHRYVDKADALRPGEPGCQPEEETEVPLSPVVTPGGNLLVYSGAQSEGQIWEVPTPGSESGEGELEAKPTMLYDEHQVGSLLNMEPPEGAAGPVMSFVAEGPAEGRIYLAVEGIAHEPIPLALHYVESGDKASQVSEIGWTAGGAGEMCGIPSPDNVTAVVGAGHERVLVLDAYLEELTHSPRVESFAFGPGGSTSGCPQATLTAPHMIFGLSQNAPEAPTDEPVTLSSELKGADAKSVKWELKYKDPATGEEGQETVEQTSAQLRNKAGEYEFLPLKYEFKHAGNYEISEVVEGDDLAGETVKAAEVLDVVATATTPILKPALPKAVRVDEEEATLSVIVEDPNASEKPEMHLKKVKWEFGDGTSEEVKPPVELANPGELKIKHKFVSRCKGGKCKITLTVEDTAAEGTPAVTTFEIAVTESLAEAKEKQEAAEKAAKEAQEAKERQEAAEKAAKEAQEAKERQETKEKQEAAEKAAKEAQEAKTAKEAKEKEEAKKHAEEISKKAPTRAQRLAKALKVCKKDPKNKRAKCEATARKKYGPKGKKRKKK